MRKHIHTLLVGALCACIVSLVAQPVHAGKHTEKGPALIDRKGPNALMFDGHGLAGFVDRYMAVTFRTRFFDENGEQISLADLKIPCQAQIEYRKISSTPVPEAISVQVEYYPDDRPVDTKFNLPFIKPEPPQ